MKLLLFSDLHCDSAAARSLAERAPAYDVLIGAGDFGTMRTGLGPLIAALSAGGPPAVLVPGNAESVEELREACQDWPEAHVLHGNGVTLFGREFYGLGGGIPVTPFGDWSYDFTEEQAAEMLLACPAGCVLVTHSPPQGAVDETSRGENLGSTAIREAVERTQPSPVVCGHIHGCWGRLDYIGNSPVLNAGPQGVEWRLGEPTA